jgi:hypothetical protein
MVCGSNPAKLLRSFGKAGKCKNSLMQRVIDFFKTEVHLTLHKKYSSEICNCSPKNGRLTDAKKLLAFAQ